MKERESDARFSKQPIERYQWPLAAAIASIVAALLLGERRRDSALVRAAAMLLLCAAPAGARHAGIEKFESKDYSGALGEFDGELKRRELAELHFNAGTAAYELGDYERAADSFSRALGTAAPELKPRATYNFANTLAHRGVKHEKKEDKLGDLKESLRQYDEVLAAEPGHADAKHNREIVAKLIEELEKEEKKDEQKQDQQDQKKDDKEKKDQEKSQGGKDDQQKQQPQDSKQDGAGKDEKDKQESQGGGKEDKDKKDSQQKGDGQQDKKDEAGQKDPAAGKQGPEQKTGDEKPGEPKDGQPEPPKGEPEKPKTGELKAANPGEQQEQDKREAEAAEATAAALEGRMTEKDAAQMLEALRKFDRRVRLLDPSEEQPKNPNRPFKNW